MCVCMCACVFSHTGKYSASLPPKTQIPQQPNTAQSQKQKPRTLNVILDIFFLPFLNFQTSTSVVAAPPSNPLKKFSLAVMDAKDVTIGWLLLC